LYARAILASHDTDLVPAVEFVADTYEKIKVFTVGWEASAGVMADVAAPLDIPSWRVTRRVMPVKFFERARDRTNHAKPATPPQEALARADAACLLGGGNAKSAACRARSS